MTIYRKVKRVIDRDTFQTYRKIQGTDRVRIAGLYGAELNTVRGRLQRDQMKSQIQGKVVTLQPVGRSYSRVVANVRHNRRLVR